MYRIRTVVLRVVSMLLALLLIAAGIIKFVNPAVQPHFIEWAYPNWAGLLVGALEIGAAVLLLFPKYAWQGAAVAGVLMAGAAGTLYWNGDLLQALVPGVLFGVCALAAYANHPWSTVVSRLRIAADRFYERELEEARRRAAFHATYKQVRRLNGQVIRPRSSRLAGSGS